MRKSKQKVFSCAHICDHLLSSDFQEQTEPKLFTNLNQSPHSRIASQ
jgi:hypothetical protein